MMTSHVNFFRKGKNPLNDPPDDRFGVLKQHQQGYLGGVMVCRWAALPPEGTPPPHRVTGIGILIHPAQSPWEVGIWGGGVLGGGCWAKSVVKKNGPRALFFEYLFVTPVPWDWAWRGRIRNNECPNRVNGANAQVQPSAEGTTVWCVAGGAVGRCTSGCQLRWTPAGSAAPPPAGQGRRTSRTR